MRGIDDLGGLKVFERMVTLGSMTKAAQHLGITLAAASKRLTAFEHRLGILLIQRNTRTMSVTAEGEKLYPYALRVINELQAAEATLLEQDSDMTGTLKLTAPYSFGHRHLLPLLSEFYQLYPNLQLQLDLSDDCQDLLAKGYDMAIRNGVIEENRYQIQPLIENHRILCAAPDYIRRHGAPKSLQQLTQHRCIVIGSRPDTIWKFDHEQKIHLHGAICCSDGEAAHQLALGGHGIVMKSAYDVAQDLQNKQLLPILTDVARAYAPINLLFLNRHGYIPQRVKALREFLSRRFSHVPSDTI